MYESMARRHLQPGSRGCRTLASIQKAKYPRTAKAPRWSKPNQSPATTAHAHPCSRERRFPRQSEHAAKPPLGFDRRLLLFPAGHVQTHVLHQGPEVIQVVLRGGERVEGVVREGPESPGSKRQNGPVIPLPLRKAHACALS